MINRKEVFWKKERREWDSNPRNAFTFTRFPSVLLKPLGHPSLKEDRYLNSILEFLEVLFENRDHSPMKKLLFLIFSCTLFVSCEKRHCSTQKPTLLVSVAPYQNLVERIAGDSFQVTTVVPPGANPHAYEPTAKQISAIGQGILWFRIGESFENKIFPVLQEKNRELTECDLRQSVSLIHESACKCHAEIQEDRHFWMSPKELISQVHMIKNALSTRFPESKETFEANSIQLIRELKALDIELKTILEKGVTRSFLVSHPAFAYFCKEYHLEQLSVEMGGKEPTAKHLTDLMQTLETRKVKLALAMPQHSNKGVEILSEKLAISLHTIDPYAPDAFETMRELALLLVDHE